MRGPPRRGGSDPGLGAGGGGSGQAGPGAEVVNAVGAWGQAGPRRRPGDSETGTQL